MTSPKNHTSIRKSSMYITCQGSTKNFEEEAKKLRASDAPKKNILSNLFNKFIKGSGVESQSKGQGKSS